MIRHDVDRLGDILIAIQAIRQHLTRGSLDDGLVFDAVRVRLIEIGEAVKDLNPALLASETGVPWTEVARMRDQLAHRYFDTSHAIVQATVDHDLAVLESAVARTRIRFEETQGVRTTEDPSGLIGKEHE